MTRTDIAGSQQWTAVSPFLGLVSGRKWVQSTELDIVNGSFCNLCKLAIWLALHIFATQCWRAPRRAKQLSTVPPPPPGPRMVEKDDRGGGYLVHLHVNNEETKVTSKLPCYLANERIIKDRRLEKTSQYVWSLLGHDLSFVNFCRRFVHCLVFVSFPSFISPRTQLTCYEAWNFVLLIQRLLRYLEISDPEKSSEFSRINRSIRIHDKKNIRNRHATHLATL